MKHLAFRRTAEQFDGFLQQLKSRGIIRSQNDFAKLVLKKITYKNLSSEFSALRLGKKIPSLYIINAVCKTLIDCGIGLLKVEVFAQTAEIEKQKIEAAGIADVEYWRRMLAKNLLDTDPKSKMETLKRILKAHNSRQCLTIDEQVAYLCDFFDLQTPFFSRLRQRLVLGETVTPEEFSPYFFSDMPQLANFGNFHHLYYHDANLAKRCAVPSDKIDLRNFDKIALEKVCDHLKQQFRNRQWQEQTTIGYYLSRLMPYLSGDDDITDDIKQIVAYDSEGEGFWVSNTSSLVLLNTQREQSRHFFRDMGKRLNDGIATRAKITYKDTSKGGLFDACMGLFMPALQENTPLRNHHVIMSYLGELRCAAPIIAACSPKIPFSTLEKITDLVWAHDNWHLAQSMSLDLVQQFSGYLDDKDQSRATALLEKFTPNGGKANIRVILIHDPFCVNFR